MITLLKKSSATNPNHYKQGSIETKELIKHMTIGLSGWTAVCVGNLVKYIHRAKYKNGAEDIGKAYEYVGFMNEDVNYNTRLVTVSEVARQGGMDGNIWCKLYEPYLGNELATDYIKKIIETLNTIITGTRNTKHAYVDIQAYLLLLQELFESGVVYETTK